MKINPAPTYRFECTLCGDCCWGNQVVRLNKEDLILMASHLSLKNTSQLFSHGLVEAVREDLGWRPRIRFKKKPGKFCPFLVNQVTPQGLLQGLCSLHPHFKPLVCHLAPLGRTVDLKDSTENWVVAAPVEGCPGMGRGPLQEGGANLAPLRSRLDRETEFFKFLETHSPGCNTAEEAVCRLFTWPVVD